MTEMIRSKPKKRTFKEKLAILDKMTNVQCKAVANNTGKRCSAMSSGTTGLCWRHDPAFTSRRSLSAARGAHKRKKMGLKPPVRRGLRSRTVATTDPAAAFTAALSGLVKAALRAELKQLLDI